MTATWLMQAKNTINALERHVAVEFALPFLVALAVTIRLTRSAIDPDYWWHLATGRWILDHGRIPTRDPFSATHQGGTWFAHEWLSELVLAVVDKVAGYTGGALLTLGVVTVGAWLLGRSARYYGAGALGSLVLGAGVAVYFYYRPGFLAVRPQTWSWALIAVLLHELAAHDTGRRKSLWRLPVLFAVWINIHLSALIGLSILALYAAHCGLRWWESRNTDMEAAIALRHIAVVFGLSALALCLNPRGPALLWFAQVYATNRSLYAQHIAEWRRPEFDSFGKVLYALGAAYCLVVAIAMWRWRRLWPGVLVLTAAIAAVQAIRYVPLFGLLAVPSGGWLLRATRRVEPSSSQASPSTIALVCGALIVGLSPVLNSRIRQDDQTVSTVNAASSGYPVGAVAWLRGNNLKGPIFNEYAWGGYLIYSLFPANLVYIDGRAEMYGEHLFRSYTRIMSGEDDWEQVFSDNEIIAAVVRNNGILAFNMSNSKKWYRAYSDGQSVVFVPAGSVTAERKP